jgi:hypothetical protein
MNDSRDGMVPHPGLFRLQFRSLLSSSWTPASALQDALAMAVAPLGATFSSQVRTFLEFAASDASPLGRFS